jgi:hypothetical protein
LYHHHADEIEEALITINYQMLELNCENILLVANIDASRLKVITREKDTSVDKS